MCSVFSFVCMRFLGLAHRNLDFQSGNKYQSYFYCPQMKLWKGNVFTSVCQEFCPRGVYPSMHLAGGVCIPACTGQGVCVYSSMHWVGVWQAPPPGKHPPGQTHPLSPMAIVCILLECILVSSFDQKNFA